MSKFLIFIYIYNSYTHLLFIKIKSNRLLLITTNIIKTKKAHKILICKTNEKLNNLFVNRDNNSILNMKKIVLNYITKNQRPKTKGFSLRSVMLCITGVTHPHRRLFEVTI